MKTQSDIHKDALDADEGADEEVYVRTIEAETGVKEVTSVQKQFAEAQQQDPEFGELVHLQLE